MKIFLDTNVFISALLNPHSTCSAVVENVIDRHELILCDYVIEECYTVAKRKFPTKITVLDDVFSKLRYELIPTLHKTIIQIADIKDQPILNSILHSNVDILITGDKHFLTLDIEKPEIMVPNDFLEKYCCPNK